MVDAVVVLLAGRVERDEEGGWLFSFPEDVDIDLKSLHIVVTEPGQIRGNHVHPTRVEYLFFFGGRGVFAWEEKGNIREVDVGESGHLIKIAAGTKHAFQNTGEAPAYILACKGPSKSVAADTIPAQVLPGPKLPRGAAERG
jgi:mannose-6-phosphate isomerase-like protein (cupin superfamily)